MFEPLIEIWSTLEKNKLRTFLTALSVAWGMFMLVILLGAGRGLENGVKWEFRREAVNAISIANGQTSVPWKGRGPGRDISFKTADYEALPKQIPNIDHITGRFYMWGEFTVSYRGKHSPFEVRGTHPDHRYIQNTEMIEGRYLDDLDIAERRKVAVIGSQAKDFLFGSESPIGQHINIHGLECTVVGVFQEVVGEAQQRQIFVPITMAQLVYHSPDSIHQLLFTIGDAGVERSREIAETAHRILAARHDFSPDDGRAVRVRNNLEQFVRITGILSWIRIVEWVVGIGTLLAGIVGISNIMLISVAERTKEIGIRKAVGATPSSIIRMILAEAMLITGAAGYLGLIAGVACVELADRYAPKATFMRHPDVDVRVALMATALIVVASGLAGFFPAWRAARVNPIVALRDE
jgi:putative ABC transport system permease protein